MTEVLNGILRAVRQPTAAKVSAEFELGKLLSQNELQRSACQPRPIRPNVLDWRGAEKGNSVTWHGASGHLASVAVSLYTIRPACVREGWELELGHQMQIFLDQ